MCGIVGIADFTGRPVASTLLEESATLIRHRGPDASGIWTSSINGTSVGFAHQRLAVLDLRTCAEQPMHNVACASTGRASPLALVFNGEIYNFRALRKDLIARGHHFVSDTDSEVLLHLYEEFGQEMLAHLHGMFAFVIWDAQTQRLFCARDRLGKKPFYFRYTNKRFWFASEPRAILSDPTVPREVDPLTIRTYLTLGYVPGSRSAFKGLQRLLPAHSLSVDRTGIKQERYWTLAYGPKMNCSEIDAAHELRARLEESVRVRLQSDVPLGAFLSGGADSSAIVALMSQAGTRVKTFSIGFKDPRYNELPYARLVANKYRTEHHEFVVDPDVLKLAPTLAWHYGEPYADSSALPTYQLAQLAKPHITVALNGDGGDEAFAGYRRYRSHWLAAKYLKLPESIRGSFATIASILPTGSDSRGSLYDVKRFFGASNLPSYTQYASWFGFFGARRSELNPAFADMTDRAALYDLERAFTSSAALHPVDAAIAADVSLYLPDDLLVKVDIATMAHGVEARSPLLDHTLMEFAAKLPISLKVRLFHGKHLLRRACRDLVPDEILTRRKTGFAIPLDHWLRGDLGTAIRERLIAPASKVTDYVDKQVIVRLFDDHCQQRETHGHRLWALYMLEQWHAMCLSEHNVVPSPSLPH